MRILALDGGGMCGIVTLRILSLLQRDYEEFDIIAGTSTGGIIAAGLAVGLTTDELRSKYYSMGEKVFYRSLWERIVNVFGINKPMYNIHNLKELLYNTFRKRIMGYLDPEVVLPVYSLYQGRCVDLSTAFTPDALLYKSVASTCAAPWYFSGYNGFVDGGVAAPNPSMRAIRYALRKGANMKDIELTSIGTGRAELPIKDNKHAGGAEWAFEIAPMMISSMVEEAHQTCKTLPLADYVRYDIDLPTELSDMTDAQKETMDAREYLVDTAYSKALLEWE